MGHNVLVRQQFKTTFGGKVLCCQFLIHSCCCCCTCQTSHCDLKNACFEIKPFDCYNCLIIFFLLFSCKQKQKNVLWLQLKCSLYYIFLFQITVGHICPDRHYEQTSKCIFINNCYQNVNLCKVIIKLCFLFLEARFLSKYADVLCEK